LTKLAREIELLVPSEQPDAEAHPMALSNEDLLVR
jgi:hypothetical protein